MMPKQKRKEKERKHTRDEERGGDRVGRDKKHALNDETAPRLTDEGTGGGRERETPDALRFNKQFNPRGGLSTTAPAAAAYLS